MNRMIELRECVEIEGWGFDCLFSANFLLMDLKMGRKDSGPFLLIIKLFVHTRLQLLLRVLRPLHPAYADIHFSNFHFPFSNFKKIKFNILFSFFGNPFSEIQNLIVEKCLCVRGGL